MNIEDLKKQIEFITSSEYHDGEFGHAVDVNSFPKKYREANFLESYLQFLRAFGYGELDSSFYIEEQPLEWNEVFPKERNHLMGMCIFATDQGEYCYAFDSKSNFEVVEIAADGELSESTLGDFRKFIADKLNDLVDIVKWRHENL
ncbi:hypothetical protein [Marinomonas sp.]|uniref:hypothetical protein n=1 Tax=Marinomonas sp. TaxID=1904862 RepID=UPI003BABF7F5